MTVAVAGTWIFAVLLAVAGVRKIAAPAATGAALQGARLPSDHRLVRLLGAGEVVLAAAVLGLGGAVPAAVLAVAYAAFAAFAYRQSRRGAGCGCFGDADAPATSLHVVIDAAGAVAAAVAATASAPSLTAAVVRSDVLTAVLTVALLGLGAAAVASALTALPDLAVAAALVEGDDA